MARIVFGFLLGLGVDESYMVAAGRKLQLSYFDHPPIAWWMAWGAAHLAGSESAIVVRLPFIVLFALTTWLMYRVAGALFGAPAGLWAAVLLNLVPVFGITSATWVLPDGPLLAALLGATLCLAAALRSNGRAAWGWWAAAGLCAGLALSSKYSAVLSIIGVVLFLTTEPTSRSWLSRPHPYAAGLIVLAVFTPVLFWNAEHGWVSFLFQGGRAIGGVHPLGPVLNIAGQAAFILPWIWAPLVWCGLSALRRGPGEKKGWLLVCLAAPPIIVFTTASLWSNVLFHWAAPGYLMLLPLLGAAVARRWRDSRPVRIWLGATAAFVVVGAALFASEIRFDWLPRQIGGFALKDHRRDIIDWTALRQDFASRRLFDRPGLVVGALRWSDAGKIDYALGGRLPVICLGPDPRQYGLIAPLQNYDGADVVVVAPGIAGKDIAERSRPLFERLEDVPPINLAHAGRSMPVPLMIGHRLRPTGGPADSP